LNVTLEEQQKHVRLIQAVDAINHLWGQDTTFFGALVRTRSWQMRQERRSPRYTTHWHELLEVSV
jgi:DNA polymerase V